MLDPSRESLRKLLDLKALMGEYNFSSQYQQNPIPLGGAIIKPEWLFAYEPAAPLPHFSFTLQSWDTANKSGELNDYSVCTTWGRSEGRNYLLDVFRARLDYPTLKRKVIELRDRWNPDTILIEDKASGTQLIQDLRNSGVYRVKPYQPIAVMDKVMRLHAVTAEFEAGKVLLPTDAPWRAAYVNELISFPGSKYDDQVDSTTQALDHLKTKSGAELWAKLAG